MRRSGMCTFVPQSTRSLDELFRAIPTLLFIGGSTATFLILQIHEATTRGGA